MRLRHASSPARLASRHNTSKALEMGRGDEIAHGTLI
jgi:hypothetical protein